MKTMTETTRTIELVGEDILRFLNGPSPAMNLSIPLHAHVVFKVPDGTGYEGMQVEINKANPIMIIWTEGS